MRATHPILRRLVLATGLAALLLPASAGMAADTDLFRTDVPPNILLLVDNSSSMAQQVYHPDYGLQIDDGTGTGTLMPAKNQTECEFFRDIMGNGKFTIYVDVRRVSYKDGDNNTMRWESRAANLDSWEQDVPVLDPNGNPMFDDIDKDGVQDAGEMDMYYRFPDPEQNDADWNADTGNEAMPIKDAYGNHLFWDDNGNGTQQLPNERWLYYEWNTSKSKPRGKGAKIVSRITPAQHATTAGIDLLTLGITNNNLCGVNATGWSFFDGDDPLAAAPSGAVMKLQAQYWDWVFSSHGSTARDITFVPTIANDGVRNKSGCVTLVGTEVGTYDTLRRSRIQALTLILRTVICEVNQVGDVRFGFAQFRFAGKGGDDNGGYVAVPINDWFDSNGDPNQYDLHGVTDTHEEHLRRVIRTAAPDAQTPLAESLFQIYTYFMPRTVADLPEGRDWDGTTTGTKFPVYNYDTSLYDPLLGYDADDDDFPPNLDLVGGLYVGPVPLDATADAHANAAPDPVLYPCQKNFVLMITDGGSSGDDFTDNDDKINSHFNPIPTVETHTDIGYSDFLNLIGDHYRADALGTADETETTAGTATRYMDDVAYFMNRWDFRPDLDGDQTIDTYTVGYSTESGASGVKSNVELAADRGNGKYFESSDADKLADDIVEAITDMIDKAQAFTSATVPASRTTDGDNFYASFFLPKEDSPWWEGHLKNFTFTAGGDIVTPDGKCATGTDIEATPPCTSGVLRSFETAHWDVADQMPDPADRKLYVEFGATSMFSQPAELIIPPGQEAAAAATLGLVAGVDILVEPYDALTVTTDPDDLAVALVDAVRGCEFGSSPCEPRTNDALEKIYMGDIFHSNPVVVGSPNSPINEPSYQLFANAKRQRTRVIYAGANDGFLHGFNAGDWDGALSPPRHDRGTGQELMGFMPAEVRDNIKELPKETSFPRAMETADGSPIVSDIWFYRNVVSGQLTGTNPILDPGDAEDLRWRTVLMAGLRSGGESYYALDVTDPPPDVATATSVYPRYLWGFPCDDCGNAVNGSTASEATWMGQTWSEPVITRIRVKSQFGSDPNGYDRWVAIFGAGYHPHGDPNGADYRQFGDAGFTPKGRAIYMVDITTGEVLAKKHYDPTAPLGLTKTPQQGVAEFHYAFASSPAVFDLNFDGYADVVYIGDLGGNLWKWVINTPGDDPINNTTQDNDPDQPDWPFRRIFRAGTSLEDPGVAGPELPPEQTGGVFTQSVHYQSLFFPPTGALRQGKLVLAFGAGERANPKGPDAEYGDLDPTNNNHYYVVKDSAALELGSADPHAIDDSFDEDDLADFDDPSAPTCAVMQATLSGYFITGRDAEKFITNSVVFLGIVFTGSFLPPDPLNAANICDSSGSAFLYAFDLDCGVGIFTTNPGGNSAERRTAIGSGIPTRPRVSVGGLNQGGGGGGCTSKVVVITSDGYIQNDCPGPLPSSGVNIRSWRQR